jgi:hypothetical protein
MTYDSDGKGYGWVGEVYVTVQARSIAPGRYNSKFQVQASSKTLPWTANDGHMTLLEDGTLQVQYPSHGIREYWKHADGRGSQILSEARNQACANSGSAANTPKTRQRDIKLVFRKFGESVGAKKDGLLWHWALSIDDSIYEVNGAMAVIGPNGVVAASSPFTNRYKGTDVRDFHGYIEMPQTTEKTDEDIEAFTCRWVKLHPVYHALGPNCQTYADDLFTFLTGEDLPFAKTADKMVGRAHSSKLKIGGPEANRNVVWLDPNKKPSYGGC